MKLPQHDPDGFIEFWTLWRPHMRHTDGRGKAREPYRKQLLRGAEPTDIIDGAKAYLRHHKSLPTQKQEFIPLASSWLNAESYSDWCEQERDYQARLAETQDRRSAPPPKPIEQPVQAPHEDRAAIAKRVFEKYGVGGVH